jgi:hypothetical protein
MTCDASINSASIRTQSLYIPCAPLMRAGYAGASAAGISNPATQATTLRSLLITAYGAGVGDFEIITNALYLRLPCDRAGYKPNFVYPNGEPSYTRSLSGRVFNVRTYVREIEVKIKDERAYLYYLVNDISRATLSANLKTKTELTMLDAVLPESDAFRIAIANGTNPVSARRGVLKLVLPSGGSGGLGSKRSIQDGFGFKFEEADFKMQ